MNNLKTWTKVLITAAAAATVLDCLRGWPWAKKVAAVFVKKDENRA